LCLLRRYAAPEHWLSEVPICRRQSQAGCGAGDCGSKDQATHGKDTFMKRIVLVVAGLAVLALPAPAAAAKPTKYELMLSRIECGKERGADPVKRADFRAKYPAKNSLNFCIRLKAQEMALSRSVAPMEARISCQQAKVETPPAEFRLEYPGGIKQCVAMEQERVAWRKPTAYEKLLARVECGLERGTDPVKRAEFKATYAAKNPLKFCIAFKALELAIERAAAPAEARIACNQAKVEAPAEFRLEYPGGLKQCITLESMP
jgi:hypothetical protein